MLRLLVRSFLVANLAFSVGTQQFVNFQLRFGKYTTPVDSAEVPPDLLASWDEARCDTALMRLLRTRWSGEHMHSQKLKVFLYLLTRNGT